MAAWETLQPSEMKSPRVRGGQVQPTGRLLRLGVLVGTCQALSSRRSCLALLIGFHSSGGTVSLNDGTGPTPARNRAKHSQSLAYESALRFSSQVTRSPAVPSLNATQK
jgi:hypothetical protein